MTDTSFFTAVFAAEAIRAFADMLFKERKGPLALAVEGFGKVASHLAGMLEPDAFASLPFPRCTDRSIIRTVYPRGVE
jgi:hypothetical protein